METIKAKQMDRNLPLDFTPADLLARMISGGKDDGVIVTTLLVLTKTQQERLGTVSTVHCWTRRLVAIKGTEIEILG